jgi:hypothetical protein
VAGLAVGGRLLCIPCSCSCTHICLQSIRLVVMSRQPQQLFGLANCLLTFLLVCM